ncbi:MAG: metallophosphoesterase [Candidatus Coproplasma sp.]
MEPVYIVLICIGAVILAVALAIFIYLSNNLLHTSFYEVKSPKIEKAVKIVQLSDLHAKSFGKGNVKLLDKVKEQSPDIIAITGDIIHKYRDGDIKVALEFVEGLVKIAPVYYVSGNHEMRNKRYRVFKERLALAGAVVLENEAVSIDGITLCGVNCADIKGGKFFHILEGKGEDSSYKLLLAHLPQYIQKYALAGFDCVLCGHAHGGQWRIPFTNIGLFAPGQGVFPKYVSGVYTCGDTKEIVSRGLGNSQCPLRLFNRPEIVVVNLVGSDVSPKQ